ncbi:hypothetical protein KFL_002070090 [Klebsormidium nitens]|uniref:DUF642 domain-containing protein n=1 Tax=Klebsormidium nitens TaxID=105231 RepID=A0A1Y1I2W5_KLENI|nr:hypothetical protein KFL_002070090 [Klebsormidium nitens]|eukprot:GAQ84813.1 hypothetical protein KFL_002070090 [Klebsormidium nitens]
MARPRAFSHWPLAIVLLLLGWISVNVSAQPYPPFSPSPSGDNLLVNGDFEDASSTSDTFVTIDPRNSTGAYLTGWEIIYNPYNPDGTPSGGNIEVDGNFQWQPFSGNRSIDMAGTSGGAMRQSFSTAPRATYQLQFALARNPDNFANDQSLRWLEVSVGDAEVEFSVSANDGSPTRADMQYSVQTVPFTANGTVTTLLFAEGGNTAADGYGCVIDGAIVTFVSVPPVTGNLLLNPDFEEGTPFTEERFYRVDPRNLTGYWLANWDVIPSRSQYAGTDLGSIEVNRYTYWEAYSGERSIDMAGQTPGAISQSFVTTPGALYDLSFALSRNPESSSTDVKTLVVDVGNLTGGSAQYFPVPFDPARTTTNMLYTLQRLTFAAVSNETTLVFYEEDATSSAYGAVIDYVAATESDLYPAPPPFPSSPHHEWLPPLRSDPPRRPSFPLRPLSAHYHLLPVFHPPKYHLLLRFLPTPLRRTPPPSLSIRLQISPPLNFSAPESIPPPPVLAPPTSVNPPPLLLNPPPTQPPPLAPPPTLSSPPPNLPPPPSSVPFPPPVLVPPPLSSPPPIPAESNPPPPAVPSLPPPFPAFPPPAIAPAFPPPAIRPTPPSPTPAPTFPLPACDDICEVADVTSLIFCAASGSCEVYMALGTYVLSAPLPPLARTVTFLGWGSTIVIEGSAPPPPFVAPSPLLASPLPSKDLQLPPPALSAPPPILETAPYPPPPTYISPPLADEVSTNSPPETLPIPPLGRHLQYSRPPDPNFAYGHAPTCRDYSSSLTTPTFRNV